MKDDGNREVACPENGRCADIFGTICWLDLAIFFPEFKICSLTFSAELREPSSRQTLRGVRLGFRVTGTPQPTRAPDSRAQQRVHCA